MACEKYVEPGGGTAPASTAAINSLISRAQSVRLLGFHLYDHQLGTRERYYAYAQPPSRLSARAAALGGALFNGSGYLAMHVRLADAHWERTDCKHTINGQPVPSISCGDPNRQIGAVSMAAEVAHVLERARRVPPPGGLGAAYLASNMNCSDGRVHALASRLAARGVRLVCDQRQLLEHAGGDSFVASLLEQELCARAHAFLGSKYSTWTDTVLGARAHGRRLESYSFEDLWAAGIR